MQKNVLNKYKKAFSSLDIFIVLCILLTIIIFALTPKYTGVVLSDNSLKEIDISKDPEQTACYLCETITLQGKGKNFVLYPLSYYKISGIVLAKNTFFVMDTGAEISPIDIGIAWGKMAEPEYDSLMKYSSSGRFLHWNYNNSKSFPFSYRFLNSHVSHNHIIPANNNILQILKSVKIKEKLYMEGYLVNVYSKYGKGEFHWNTSLSRYDTEAGACELLYVKRVRVGNNFYE